MDFKKIIAKLQNLPDNKKQIILWGIVGVLAVVMGIFWFRNTVTSLSKIPSITSNITLPKVDIPNLNLPTTKDPTTDWKTYANTEYGFEIKYPKDLSLKSETGNIISLEESNAKYPLRYYWFRFADKKSDISELNVSASSQNANIKKDTLVVNSVNWNTIEEVDYPINGMGTISSVFMAYTQRENPVFLLSCINCNADAFGNDGSNRKLVFDQILSTFKFTK